MTRRVALYARLSVTTEESVSIDRQLSSARSYAEARGWTVVLEQADDGVSATKIKPEDRPGWRSLLESREQYDAVVVWKIDRLARRVLDFLNADQALQERGAGVVAVEDPIDMSTAQGRAFATMLSVFAEMEAASISARVTAARHALIRSGRRAGGRPPYGWMNIPNPDGPGMVLAQDPERISYVSQIAAQVLAGASLYAATRWLDQSGAPKRPHASRKSDLWAEASVEAILRNPVLAGMTTFKPGRKAGTETQTHDVLRGADGLPIVDESVAILSTEEHRSLIEKLDAAKRPGSRPKSATVPTLLASLCRCATCGSVMHRARVGGQYESYRCASRTCEKKAGINLPQLTEYIADLVLAERGEVLLMSKVDTTPDTTEELGDVEQAIRDTTALMTEDDADLVGLTRRLQALKETRTKLRSVKPARANFRLPTERYAAAWSRTEEISARRDLLMTQLTQITIQPGDQTRNRFSSERVDVSWIPTAIRVQDGSASAMVWR